jgi:hypothetical protein
VLTILDHPSPHALPVCYLKPLTEQQKQLLTSLQEQHAKKNQNMVEECWKEMEETIISYKERQGEISKNIELMEDYLGKLQMGESKMEEIIDEIGADQL